jgi:type VI secretion system protein ImpL
MATQTMPAQATNTGTLDSLVRDANAKLAGAGRKGGTLHTLPLLYLLGDTNAAKTTAVLRTGWNAELLAGEAMRDGEVCPTSTLNLWYTDGLVIAEAGAALRGDPAQLKRLYAQTRPGSLGTAFKGQTPLRAAVVAVSCERLLGPSGELQTLAAKTGDQLRELARFLGTTVPVYVLFTKADRIPSFAAWARNLSTEEAGLLLGAAPRNFSAGTGGTWAESASASILQSYDALLTGLAGTRLPLLSREADTAKGAEAYEFPREMRKLRAGLAAFLVELVRPSQLSASPLLRGFYFTGVRAHIVEQVITEAAPIETRSQQDAGATQIFSALGASRSAGPAPQVQRTMAQKTAQWTFLPRFFPQAVVADAKELAAGTGSTRYVSLVKRLVYGTAAVLCLLLLIAFTVSYAHNHAFEQQTLFADQQLQRSETGGVTTAAVATETQLQDLDALRAQVVQMEAWKRDGAPLGYRWGLYHGDQMLSPARRAYFQHFRTLLLERTQNNLVQELSALPSTPPPGADYNGTYSALRSYLITTSNPEKSVAAVVAPVLTQHWQNGAALPAADQAALAERQFAFYAEELVQANPYSIQPVGAAVTHARTYLNGFGGPERIYQGMLTAAGKKAPGIDFNAQFPHSAETVVEPHTVLGAFTPDGYTFMQNALAHPDVYFSGELWVLGDQAPPTIDPALLKQQLSARYESDYLATWRAFVHEARVVPGRTLADAGSKIAAVSSTNSPLLALLYTVSHNTAVPDKTIADAFQPPQAVVLPGAKDQYLGAGNKAYMDAMLALRGSIQQAVANPAGVNDPAAAAPIAAAASAAHLSAQQTAQSFRIDTQGHVDTATLALLEAPITSVDALVRGIGPAGANAAGKSFCAAMNAVFAKQPFTPNSTVQATPAEVTALLQPGAGSLWVFYNNTLKPSLVQQGSQYAVAPNPPLKLNPDFVRFFNRMADISNTFFPPGATGPSLTFVLHNVPTKGVQKAVLKVDAQTLSLGDAPKQFNWTAATASSAGLTANDIPLSFTGPWAVFQMLNKAKVQHGATPNTYDLSFALEFANTPARTADGTPIAAEYELSGPGAAVLAPGALSGVRCVAAVAH